MAGIDWLQFKKARQAQRAELQHSAKGTTWKEHKYITKETDGGKVRYVYSQKVADTVSDFMNKDDSSRKIDLYNARINNYQKEILKLMERDKEYLRESNPLNDSFYSKAMSLNNKLIDKYLELIEKHKELIVSEKSRSKNGK